MLSIPSSAHRQDPAANMSDAPAEESATTVGEVNTAPVENACTELKTAMEKCAAEKGEENCQDLIQAYKECMKSLGMQI